MGVPSKVGFWARVNEHRLDDLARTRLWPRQCQNSAKQAFQIPHGPSQRVMVSRRDQLNGMTIQTINNRPKTPAIASDDEHVGFWQALGRGLLWSKERP